MARLLKLSAIMLLVFELAGCAATAPSTEQTRASPKIQSDVMDVIRVLETASGPSCERKLAKTEVVQRATEENYAAVERWTIDRCGKPVNYLVTFRPGANGGVDFSVKPEG